MHGNLQTGDAERGDDYDDQSDTRNVQMMCCCRVLGPTMIIPRADVCEMPEMRLRTRCTYCDAARAERT